MRVREDGTVDCVSGQSPFLRACQTIATSRRGKNLKTQDDGSTECLAQHPRSSTGSRVGASGKRVRAADRSSAGGKTHGNQTPPQKRDGKGSSTKWGRGGLTLGTVCIFAEGSSFYSAREQRATMCAMGRGPRGAALSGVQGIRILSSHSQDIIVSFMSSGFSETRVLSKKKNEGKRAFRLST